MARGGCCDIGSGSICGRSSGSSLLAGAAVLEAFFASAALVLVLVLLLVVEVVVGVGVGVVVVVVMVVLVVVALAAVVRSVLAPGL